MLVHAHAPGDLSGAAAFDPQGPDAAPIVSTSSARPALSAAALQQIEATLRALAVSRGPLELEWTWRRSDDAVTFLQLRPYRSPTPVAPWPGLSAIPASERDEWRWDAAHNPLPLSIAQRDLVGLVDEHCRTGVRLRVLGGYLFYAPGGPLAPSTIAPEQARAAFDDLRTKVESRLTPAPALEPALALFLSSYEPLMGVIQPAARAGRRALEEHLREEGPEALAALPALLSDVESMASERRRRAGNPAAYQALFGDEAPGGTSPSPPSPSAPGPLWSPPSHPRAGKRRWPAGWTPRSRTCARAPSNW